MFVLTGYVQQYSLFHAEISGRLYWVNMHSRAGMFDRKFTLAQPVTEDQ